MMQAPLTTFDNVETNRKSAERKTIASVYRHSTDGIDAVIPDRADQANHRQAGNWGKA